MSIPKISEFTIRRYANAKSYQRGEAYFESGAVDTITRRGNLLQAEVDGSEARPYRVNLSFDGHSLTSANCTCAYNFDGWCKHIVATMLVCVRQPEIIEHRPTLAQLLDRLDHVQTQRLVQELVAEQPQLIEAIDRHVTWMTNTVAQPKKLKSLRQNIIDTNPVRRQVRQIIHEAVRYFEDGCEEDPISEELLSLVQSAVNWSEQGEGKKAIAVLEAITSTCIENWYEVAEYGAEYDEIAWELNNAWCEAILSAELTPEEKIDTQVNLEVWQDEWEVDFSLSLEALRQGWDYPPLVQVLQGKICERGAWEATIPDYADELALIRLKILERQERYQEYLYLAEAEGQTRQYLTMLGRLGRVEEALEAAQSEMNSMEEAFALGKTLKEQGALQQALHIAQLGLQLSGNCQYDLGIWTSELAQKLGNKTTALQAKKIAFQAHPSLEDYQNIQDLAGEEWETVKADLLKILRVYSSWETSPVKVDIFLQEGLIDDAIAIANELSEYQSDIIHRVMNSAIPYRPEWVISHASRRAESIMNAGKAEYYDAAVEWLKKARAAYLASNRQADWSKYRAKLMATHARKRKLMGMLQQREME
ncbi:SWIM zinc finger domain-containing protein [Nostoc sp. FACHB-152]|uniref:SWIM zinc finger family protein n=1 Tax=unclassified Nostoc TaxID=2593658 RepID=UPI00168534D0|nr:MULTISPECIES: SWIM zinc finger domain-containing protein [unclassified Nostoc]MBD2449191.1 SWIM zinc finger domain-containing protein [Nostoc sp. FACHB-152]MBD2466340.1 SWIM zinc finger domain-containing protein [Nostoc sp. FACHB-145]